jgi:hypothetical protein
VLEFANDFPWKKSHINTGSSTVEREEERQILIENPPPSEIIRIPRIFHLTRLCTAVKGVKIFLVDNTT